MVGIFVELKFRLLVNGLRDTGRLVGFAIGVAVIAITVPMAFTGWWAIRNDPVLAANAAVVVFTGFTLAWAVLPLGLFGTDDTLDPAKFASLPLPPRVMVTGLFASAFVGLTPVATSLLLAGSVVSLADGPVSAVAAVLALAVEVALCVALARALASALSGVLRSRRGRDLAIFVGVLVGGSGQLIALAAANVGSTGFVADLARILRWTPPGLAARAPADVAAGHYLSGLASLAGAVLAIVLLLWWWSRTLTTAMLVSDASTQLVAGRGRATRALGRVFATGRAGAVALRELRYNWREPRRKASWVAAILFGGIGPFIALVQGGRGPTSVYVLCLTAAVIGLQAANQLGADGAATWLHVTTCAGRRDIRADFAGRNIALAVIGVPVLFVVGAVLGVLADNRGAGLRAFFVALGVLGIGLGVGNITSALVPYPLPDSTSNVFGGAAGGQGCLIGFAALTSVFVTGIFSSPLLIVALAAEFRPALGPVLFALGIGYGITMAWLGGVIASERVYPRQPELMSILARGGAT